MSLIASWMLAHAQLVAENSHGALWQLNEANLVAQFVEHFSCEPIGDLRANFYCRASEHEIWHIQILNGAYFAQSFKLRDQPLQPQNTWLGTKLLTQQFEKYRIEIFASPHRSKTLADGFSFRYGARLASVKEIEHGRYHILLENPETSVLLVQQKTVTHSIQITARAKPR
ncbi:hypothetical protein LG272_05225 [Pseudidiomarina marina]|uniref:hypothetical protein n=1 Tax=Pseudidiomarina marina TaxID=502366 RepID=UPI00384B6045